MVKVEKTLLNNNKLQKQFWADVRQKKMINNHQGDDKMFGNNLLKVSLSTRCPNFCKNVSHFEINISIGHVLVTCRSDGDFTK